MYFTGIIIAICTFLTAGNNDIRSASGIACVIAALFIENTLISAIVGVFGASALWGIGELFEQKKRVERGWFPKNPKRKY